MFKRFIQAYYMAKDFETNMKIVGNFVKKEKRYKIKITERQISILKYCASCGIDDIHQLADAIKK